MRRLCALFALVILCCAGAAWAEPTISIDPAATAVAPGDLFSVYVTINGEVLGVMGWDLTIDFDETLIDLVDVVEGSLPAGSPPSYLYWTDVGTPSAAVIINGAVLGHTVDGPGSLVELRFQALAEGVSPVHFESYQLRDIDNMNIPVTPVDGEVTVEVPGNPLMWIEPASVLVDQGELFSLYVYINEDVLGVLGWDLTIDFDETLIQLLDVVEGALPAGSPPSYLYWTDDGTPSAAVIINGAVLGHTVDGPGSLVELQFQALAPGATPVHFDSYQLRDIDNMNIPVTAVDGEVIIEWVSAVEPVNWTAVKAMYR